MANPLRRLRSDTDEDRRRNLLQLVQPNDGLLAPPENPNPLRIPSDEIQPDFRPGGDTAPTINLPELSPYPVDGRPTRNRMLLDEGARENDYQDQLSEYKPQNEGLGKTILRSALGFFAGGPGGAIAPLLTRNRSDENWRRREILGSEDRQERRRQFSRQALQDRLLNQQVINAETPDVEKPTYDWFPADTDGDGIPDTETYNPIRPGVGRQLFRKPTPENNPMVVEIKNPDGSTTRKLSYDHGRTWQVGEGLGDAPPLEKLDGGAFSNRQLQVNIKAAESERDGIWKTIEDNNIQPTMPGPIQGQVVPNPIYHDYVQRGRKLNDDIRDWKGRMKAETAARSNDPLKGVTWSKSRYRGSTPIEQAAREAETRGAIIID